MVSKKKTKITVELIAKRRVICKRPLMLPKKKTEREIRKYLEPKRYEVFKKKRAARVREYRLEKKMSEQLQVCNVNLRNNSNHVFSIFGKTNFGPKCSQD